MTKIAIVEDNKVIRESLMEFVQADPECRCVCACATGEEALKVIPKHEPEIVLMDIQLPNMSGLDCLAQMKRLLPSVHVIMVTVYEDTDRIFKALRTGACGYLLKRCTPEELIAAIREVRQGGAPVAIQVPQAPPGYNPGAAEMDPGGGSGRVLVGLTIGTVAVLAAVTAFYLAGGFRERPRVPLKPANPSPTVLPSTSLYVDPAQSASTLAAPAAISAGASMFSWRSREAAGFPIYRLAYQASVRSKRTWSRALSGCC